MATFLVLDSSQVCSSSVQLDNVMRAVKISWRPANGCCFDCCLHLHCMLLVLFKNNNNRHGLWIPWWEKTGAQDEESSFPKEVWEVARLSAVRWDGVQRATQACKNRHSNITVMSTIESWWIIITSRRNKRPAPQLMKVAAALVQKLSWRSLVKL